MAQRSIFSKVSAKAIKTNSLIVNVRATTTVPGLIYVQYKNKSAGSFVSTSTSVFSQKHSILVGRLRSLTTYIYHVYLVGVDGIIHRSDKYKFKTEALPKKLSSSLSLKLTVGTFSNASGVIVLCIAGVKCSPEFFQGYVGVDRNGYIVWYYETPIGCNCEGKKVLGTPTAGDFFQMKNGNFLITLGYALGLPNSDAGIYQAPQMQIITPAGKLVYQQPLVCKTSTEKIGKKCATIAKFGWSHAAFENPGDCSETIIYNLGQELRDPYYDANLATPGTRMQLGGTIRMWNPATNKQSVITSDFKLLDPLAYRGTLSNDAASAPVDCFGQSPGLENQDWTHDNAISRLDEKSNFFISQRNTSAVLILDPKTFKLLYKFGVTRPSDFKFASSADHFYNQHDAHEIKGGNLLMFDDGTTRPLEEGGKYGRAIEYKLDYKTRVITSVWEFQPPVNLECDNVGSARRLSNGHTIVDFGASNLTVKHVFEAGRQINTTVADLQVSSILPDVTWILYRAVPISTVFGEVELIHNIF